MNFESFREKIAYQPLLLGLSSPCWPAVRWPGHRSATGGAIAAAEAKDLRDSLSEVLPQGMADNDFLKDTVELENRGQNRDHLPGPPGRRGQGGAVQGRRARLRRRHPGADGGGQPTARRSACASSSTAETPGLGDKIEVKKDPWVKSFDGKSLVDPTPDKWAVKKGWRCLRPVRRGDHHAARRGQGGQGRLDFFAEHRKEILGGQS
jgi:electron transport complex protein RnfG